MSAGYSHNGRYREDPSRPPAQLWLVLVVLLSWMGFSWYVHYASVLEEVVEKVKLALMLLPVLLLLAVHCLSGVRSPEQGSIHRTGGSPWGVGILLIFLMFVISY